MEVNPEKQNINTLFSTTNYHIDFYQREYKWKDEMPDHTRIVAPGTSDRTVRTTDGQILHAPADWELLPPGDAILTRCVKAAGPTWTVQVKQGRKTFSRGVWAPGDRIATIRADLEAKRSTDANV